MTVDKGILIKNIYYMLAYAFQVLNQTNYQEIAAEEFEEAQDLFAAILAKGISQQLKQGLYREYVFQADRLTVLRGKLDINGTMQERVKHHQELACEFDELSDNDLYNQILKTTAVILSREPSVQPERRSALRKVVLYFKHVDTIPPDAVPWSRLRFHRSNRNYQMLIYICYLVLDGMLQTTESGKYRMAQFSDEHMAALFEKFVLEYYVRHHGELHARPMPIHWDLPEGTPEGLLPSMRTDITLQRDGKTLIIDTKYYGRILQSFYGHESYHSTNLYQIFAYVKNYDSKRTGDVSGLLLYARTGERLARDAEFLIGGNRIGVRTLDLNQNFSEITRQLEDIVDSFGLGERGQAVCQS